ncbi:Synaptotagmin-4-like protein, partial [Leptotrombidium deliense]
SKQSICDICLTTASTAVVAASVGGVLLIVAVAAVTCYLYRRRSLNKEQHTTLLLKKTYACDRPISLRRPTAVKSPGSNAVVGPTLKKSPSPTGQKTPPGNRFYFENCLLTHFSGNNSDQTAERGSELKNNIQPTAEVKDSRISPENKETKGREDRCKVSTLISLPTNVIVMVRFIFDYQFQSHESCDNLTIKRETSCRDESPVYLGKLHFKLKYNYEKHALCITVVKCEDLPAPRDANVSNSDPYVKLQLLPDKQHKVKTRVLRKTLNPIYDEDFTFYGINPTQLETTTLHFVVLSFDRYSRDDIIGEVIYQLGHLHFDTLEKQISLVQDISPRSYKLRTQGRGEILVSLCYQPAANRLTVVVLKARNLPKLDVTGLCDPYVKIYLLYNNQRIAKKKTHVKKRTTNPVFNESFVFDVPYNEGLDNLSLEFLLLDYDRVTKNEVIGKLEIGSKATGTALKHWKDVASSPRRQIAEWHKL